MCLRQLLQAGNKVPISGYSIVSIRPSLSQAEELQALKETLGRYCNTASFLSVLAVLVERPEHAIQGVIQPERVLTSGRDKDPSISLCNHPPRRRRTRIRSVIREIYHNLAILDGSGGSVCQI